MAFTKKYLNEMFGIVLVLSTLLSTVSAVDCHGKSFRCVNSTHFMICVDLGGGVSHAIDNFLVACPPPTVCQSTNHFECELSAPTIASTTLRNVISEITQPWEEDVTVSSTGNTTKEFSENYMNTERITTAEYSVTIDKNVDLTTATASELYVNNKLNKTETLAAEIATSAIETTQNLNENMNITEYVPTEVTQTTTESKNLTEIEPVILDEITKPVAETTTENIIITDTEAAETGYRPRPGPIAIEQVPQTIYENLNITGTEPTSVTLDITTTVIESVTQNTVESGNLTKPEHVVVDEFTARTTETTTDNIIITDPLGTELGYIESTGTEQITLTTNDHLLVQSKKKPPEVNILLQHESATSNILLKESPKTQHKYPLNTEKPISSTTNIITASKLHNFPISKIKNATKTDSFAKNILPVQTKATLEPIVETVTDSIDHLTTIPIDRVTDDLITAPPLDNTIKKSESVNVTEPSKSSTSFEGSLRSNSSAVENKQSAANKIKYKETQTPIINNPETPYNSLATRNLTEKVANTTKERVVGSNINSTTLQAIVTTDVPREPDAKENNLYTTTNKSLNENQYTTVNNVLTERTLINTTDTQNPAEATVLDGAWTETISNGASTEQPTTINEGSLTAGTIQNLVTECITVPTIQTVNLEILTTDLVPTTISDIQSMPPAFENNMNNDAQFSITDNIISIVNNEASTNGLMTVESENKDTITTGAMDIPTNAQPVTSFDNMTIETSLPVTENILTVTNEGSTNIFMAAQTVNMDTIATEDLDIPTTVSNTHPTPTTVEDNMEIEISLPITGIIVSTVNNGVSQNSNALATTTENIVLKESNDGDKKDSVNAQASDLTTISTDAIYMPTTITNGQARAFIDIMKNDPLPATENTVSSINNGDNTKGFMTSQLINVDEVNTVAMYGTYTTISNAQSMRPTFEDNITTDTLLPATTGNIVTAVNYGVTTNDFTTAQPANVDQVNTEATHIPTTTRSAQPKAPTIEYNMTIDVPLPATENILSSVNKGASTNGFMTTPAVNVDIINTQATINNDAPAMAPTFDDSTKTETPPSATKNIVSAINNGVSTNGLTTGKAGLETVVQLTTESYTVSISKVGLIFNNEKIVETVHGDITAESGTPFPEIIKESPNNAIQNIPTTIYIESLPEFALPSKNIPGTNLSVDKPTSDVSQIENVNKQASVFNAATLQKGASPINDNITMTTTRKSIPTFGSHLAFDISNQNLINPQVESKTTTVNNNLQPIIIERNDQADNIIWNPLANQVFNNLNHNSESMGTSVNNINAERNDRDPTSLNTEFISQKASGITESPIYVHIDHEQSIDVITTQSSIGVTSSNDIYTTNGYSQNIAKVNSDQETEYRPSRQSEIPVTISFNQKTDKLRTAGVDASYVSTALSAKTPAVTDITILDNLNIHEPMENSSSPSSGSLVVDTHNTLRKSGSKAEVFLDYKENINAKSNQDSSIISTSITNDNISEVKSSVIIGGNTDSPTIVRDNEFKLPTSSHGLSAATGVGTPMKGNKVNEERRDDTLSKPVILDVLPLPINNIQFNAPTPNIHAITDFVSNSQAKNTVIITESYKSATSRPSFAETKIQNSVKVGDIPTVPKIESPAFNFQIGVSDKISDTTTFPAVGSSTSNSQTSVFAKTVARNGDATFNLPTNFIDEAKAQPSHLEKILNKNTRAPNNAHVIPDTEPSGSGTNTGNLHNIHTPESVSNYDSQKSVNTPQETVSSSLYQNSNSTVFTNLKSASQNISFNTKKAPQKSIGSDKMQSEVTHQNNSSTNIKSSISTQAQNISSSTARTPSEMVTPNTISHVNNNLNKQVPTDAAQTFACIHGARGRYSDKDDCRKFYICIGNNAPVVGYCPETTVFSDLKKLCTRNMSHCIRKNQFKCPTAGRFSDFTKDNVYYICINHKTKLYRFKFQCQKGYILDKTTVHCIETKEIESNESVSISSSDNSSQTSSSFITSSKSISTSSKSNNSSKPDNSSSNNDNSSKSKKSNEAVGTSEKSEGNDDDDDDDEVFKCIKEGKFPIRHECRRYYLCKKNRKSEYRRKIKKCNSGKVFHKDEKKCVDDDSYEC